ncbi:hypothetical protein PG990_001366 [Apiospora arundinis]
MKPLLAQGDEGARPDTSSYKPLRPGMLVRAKDHTHAHPYFTSGVKVQHKGIQYMTGPTHGIGEYAEGICLPFAGQDRVYSSAELDAADKGNRDSYVFADCKSDSKQHIPGTDVTMVRLKNPAEYVNTTFETDEHPEIKLKRLLGPDEVFRDYQVALDSSFTGRVEGIIVAHHVEAKNMCWSESPLHQQNIDIHATTKMTVYNWMWHGQDRSPCPPGSCGSPIVTPDGIVTGFYHLSILKELDGRNWKGFSMSTSASELSGLREPFELVADT